VTKEEFLRTVDGAPIDYDELAQRAAGCSDAEIADAGERYLRALQQLLNILDENDVELG
jgi:hypothetical protein